MTFYIIKKKKCICDLIMFSKEHVISRRRVKKIETTFWVGRLWEIYIRMRLEDRFVFIFFFLISQT